MLNDVEFREVQEVAIVDKVKIVACDGKSKYLTFYLRKINEFSVFSTILSTSRNLNLILMTDDLVTSQLYISLIQSI